MHPEYILKGTHYYHPPRPCAVCGAECTPRVDGSGLYCSKSCAVKVTASKRPPRTTVELRPCAQCGMVMELRLAKHKREKRHCSAICARKTLADFLTQRGPLRGINSPSWKGGRRVTNKGYVRIYQPDHPGADKDGYVLEHRLVKEAVLGRYLAKTEEIHHINGVRDDNRPENLELWFRRGHQPKGIRLGDAPHCATCRC